MDDGSTSTIAAALTHADELDEQLIATVEKLRAAEAENERLRERIGRAVEGLDSGELGNDPERTIEILWPEK